MRRSHALTALLLVSTASAHSGAHASGWLAGLAHPLTGPDHLLAMVAVGVLAAPLGRRGLWLPAAFVGAMLLGALAGVGGAALPFAEQGIALSVVLLGLLLAFAVRLPLALLGVLVGMLGAVHGHAHGTELPAGLSAAEFFAGFTLSTAALHAAGFGIGRMGPRVGAPALRWIGLGLAVVGGRLLLGS
ncbi:urease accessory protein [Deinococcus metalli]|uniref:Urease accessory protein n=1 Tax=Deinococcus metalli TaxID=1141878 RepID=A0A7W8NNF7_9DEIO|nr:HupE/UreJ family protein [Deinococcus metalli]MBB5375711.1 urease accessory protein [Deinococcus metalli]GHF37607.1 urease accessory protein UreJ [Deinococcus metalli]